MTSRPARIRWMLMAVSLVILQASQVSAFCRSRTCKPNLESCTQEGSCITSGEEFFRPGSCVSFSVQEDGSVKHGISAQAVEQIVTDAFDRWLSVDCGGNRGPMIEVQNLGSVECAEQQYSCDHGNANIILFRDDEWPHDRAAFALSTVTHLATGEIYDADVEVNGTMAEDLVIGRTARGIDLESVLTHELGHFLGLGHSDVRDAVMRPRYDPSEDDLRLLHSDDIQGICAVYPPDRKVTSDSCVPRHGFASDCGSGQTDRCPASNPDGGCCSTAISRSDDQGGLALGAVLGGLLLARLRRLRSINSGDRPHRDRRRAPDRARGAPL